MPKCQKFISKSSVNTWHLVEGILDHIIEQLITTIFREPVVSPTTTSRGAATYAPRAIWATFDAVWTKWTMPQTFLVVSF